jgi:hypothetical protein
MKVMDTVKALCFTAFTAVAPMSCGGKSSVEYGWRTKHGDIITFNDNPGKKPDVVTILAANGKDTVARYEGPFIDREKVAQVVEGYNGQADILTISDFQ